MNIENSFREQNSENSQRKQESQLLCSELQQYACSGWNGHSLDLSADINNEHKNDSDFEKNQKQSQSLNMQNKNQSPEKQTQDVQMNSISSGPKTITLIEDMTFSKETDTESYRKSKIHSEIQNQSYSSFLYMKETVYQVHRQNYQELFNNIKNIFTCRFQTLQQTYLMFFKVKLEQQRKNVQIYKQKQKLKEAEIGQRVYINCTTVFKEMNKKWDEENERNKLLMNGIRQLYDETNQLFVEVNKIMKGRISGIQCQIQKLKQVSAQMTSLILGSKKKKDEKFYGNSYVISKYLIKTQQSYLSMLKKFTKEVISFINTICKQLQPKISIKLKEMMINYVERESYQTCDPSFKALAQLNCFQSVFNEVVDLILSCIPSSVLSQTNIEKQIRSDQYIQNIIQKLNMDVETFIFLPCIQVDESNFLYQTYQKINVRWVKTSQNSKVQEAKVNILLTKQAHMILQVISNNQKYQSVAVLRLKDIKLSQKNNKIIVFNKEKGVLGYLMNSPSVLGQLIFTSQQKGIQVKKYVDQFIVNVKQVTKNKNK